MEWDWESISVNSLRGASEWSDGGAKSSCEEPEETAKHFGPVPGSRSQWREICKVRPGIQLYFKKLASGSLALAGE